MATDVNTIVLKQRGHHDEGVADAAIRPGEAIELAADGKFDPQASAQAAALKGGLKVAKEDALQGKAVDDAYAADDVVFFYSPVQGDHLQVLVKTGEDINVGDKLVVEGGGSGLFVETAGTETKFQLEALEDSGGALAADTLLRVRVLNP
jgi:biotin carboxyl carrier protein